MKDFRQRKKASQKIYSPIILVLLFLLLLFLLRSVYYSYAKKNRASLEQQKIGQEYKDLSKRIDFLNQKIEKLSTDEGIKEELKKVNNVGEKGETIIRIVESR